MTSSSSFICYWCKESASTLCDMELRWETRAAPNVVGKTCIGCAMQRGLLGVGYAIFYANGDVLRVVRMSRPPPRRTSGSGGIDDDDNYHYSIFK